MRKILIFLFFVLTFGNLHAQDSDLANFEARPTSILEVMRRLGSDTVVFYYNERWQLVKPVCATVFRIARMDTVLLTFTGKFVDYYSSDSTIAIEGNYTKGKKEGVFKIYFPNGQLAQFGMYANDRKSGIWEYFYEDGTRQQILDFGENEILVKEFWNEQGKQLVKSGNGQWFGYEREGFLKTSGEVLDGRKNGTWKNTISFQNMTTNIEKYKEGKFLSGKMISVAAGSEPYKDTVHCTIEKTPAFLTAEQFQIIRCFKDSKSNRVPGTYPGGMVRFYEQLKKKIDLSGPISRGLIQVQITIATDGKMTNFKPVSNTGHESDLIPALQTMDDWEPTRVDGKPIIQPKIISLEIR